MITIIVSSISFKIDSVFDPSQTLSSFSCSSGRSQCRGQQGPPQPLKKPNEWDGIKMKKSAQRKMSCVLPNERVTYLPFLPVDDFLLKVQCKKCIMTIPRPGVASPEATRWGWRSG